MPFGGRVSWATIGGLAAVGVGLGTAGYLLSGYARAKNLSVSVQGLTLSLSPSELSPSGSQLLTATASWTNGTTGQVPYAVQAAVIEEASGGGGTMGGIVSGHLFRSAAVAGQAIGVFTSQGATAAAAFSADAANRLVIVRANPGAATAQLFGYVDPGAVVPPLAVVVWVAPLSALQAYSPGLIVRDATGTQLSALTVAVAADSSAGVPVS